MDFNVKDYNACLNKLTEEEKTYFDILASFLICRGWKADLSQQSFAKLLSDKTNCKIPDATAERKLKRFSELGLIDIIPHGKGRVPSTIILKSYTYKGSPITGIVPLDCPLYVKRAADEICQEALRLGKDIKGSLPFIRIKAAKGMGKSSLLIRLRQFLETEQKHVVGYVDLGNDEFDSDVFNDLDKLFYRFTEEISLSFKNYSTHLNLPSVQTFWRQERTPGANCTNYLYELFKQIKQPKTLIVDGIDRILGQKTQTDFLNVLRTWNERRMKVVSNTPIVWPSIVIAYSTDPYPDYNLPGSPLYNIGMDVELQEFTPEDILNLSKIYGLNWNLDEVYFLMSLIGGHPNLIILALHKISQENISLNELERKADLVNGPFGTHLLKFLELFKKDEALSTCFKNIIKQEKCCDEFRVWQLEKVGLIRLDEEGTKVRCELYKRYFMKNLDLKN